MFKIKVGVIYNNVKEPVTAYPRVHQEDSRRTPIGYVREG